VRTESSRRKQHVSGGSNFASYRQLSQYDTYFRYGANSEGNAIQLCQAQAGLNSPTWLRRAARALAWPAMEMFGYVANPFPLVGLATPSLTFDLNEHQARQRFRCAVSYMGGLLPPIGRCYRNPATEYRPNAGDVLPVSVGIKRDFPLHRYPPGVNHRLKTRWPVVGFRLGSLPVFDDLNDRSVTRRAFKRALVVIRLVGLDSRKPRGYAAYGALRVVDSVPIDEVGYVHQVPRPCCYRRERDSSQSPTPRHRAAASDALMWGVQCSKSSIERHKASLFSYPQWRPNSLAPLQQPDQRSTGEYNHGSVVASL
jgi:hypothetical protein